MSNPTAGPERIAAIRERLEAAHAEVTRICREGGTRAWRMTIPAQMDDSDLLIGGALTDAIELLDARAAAQGAGTSGVQLIAAERERQVSQEGWTPEHDDTHDAAEMVGAAINYAELARFIAAYGRTDGERFFHGLPPRMESWLWELSWWKPDYADAVRNLVKAGALIAAEIDRLVRAQKSEAPHE